MDKTQFYIIAIDGAAASGKSSTSRMLADSLHLMHVDTGAHYRAITLSLLQAGVDPEDTAAIDAFLQKTTLDTEVSGHRALVRINHYLPHETELKSADVNASVSQFAKNPQIREFLKGYQRGEIQVAKNHHFQGIVMEGRDIGSIILPDAPFRFYLHADPVIRSERRAAEGLEDSIAKRDQVDMNRNTAPLVCPEGAIDIDTSLNTLSEVVERIKKIIQA